MDIKDTDEGVIKYVKIHAASEGVCVIFAKVVRNGWRDDIVGFRIRVPESQCDKAVHAAWSSDISCCIWVRSTDTRQQRASNEQSQDSQRQSFLDRRRHDRQSDYYNELDNQWRQGSRQGYQSWNGTSESVHERGQHEDHYFDNGF